MIKRSLRRVDSGGAGDAGVAPLVPSLRQQEGRRRAPAPLRSRRRLPGQPGEPRRRSGGGGALGTHVQAHVNQGTSGVGARLPGRMLSAPGPRGRPVEADTYPRCCCEVGPRLPCEGTDFRLDSLGFKGLSDLARKKKKIVFPSCTVPGGTSGVLGPGGPTEVAPPSSLLGFPGGSAGEESACNAGDLGSIPRLGRSPGEGKGYPLQYSWASLAAQLVKNPTAMWETWA